MLGLRSRITTRSYPPSSNPGRISDKSIDPSPRAAIVSFQSVWKSPTHRNWLYFSCNSRVCAYFAPGPTLISLSGMKTALSLRNSIFTRQRNSALSSARFSVNTRGAIRALTSNQPVATLPKGLVGIRDGAKNGADDGEFRVV